MSYSEDDFVPLSAVAHYAHCPRRCALVHIERLWCENRFTAEGNVLHERAHSGIDEKRRDVLVVRSLPIRSTSLGLMGVTDVVEFHRSDSGVALPTRTGKWIPYPIEYKRGAAKDDHPYKVQLCAQTICLEETFGVHLENAALYVGVDRRRSVVAMDEPLRLSTRELCGKMHDMLTSGTTPPAEFLPRCRSCSLLHDCIPAISERMNARAWIESVVDESIKIGRP